MAFLTGRLDGLDGAADVKHLRAHADALRHAAVAVARASAQTQWRSRAADAFRAEASGAAQGLRHAGHRVDEAADVLHTYLATWSDLEHGLIRWLT